MTIPYTARKAGPLAGNGSTTAFPFAFKVFAASDLQVTIATSAGVETTLVLNSSYTVSLNANQDTSPGGTVTYPISGSALPVGSTLSIVGNTQYDQPLDLPSGGNFSPLALENQLDRLAMQIQQVKTLTDAGLRAPVSEQSVSMVLPRASARANRYLSFDNSGSPISTTFDVNEVAAQATASAASAAASAVSAAASEASRQASLASADAAALTAQAVADSIEAVYADIYEFSGDGVQTSFVLPVALPPGLPVAVYVDGLRLSTADASVSGTIATFSTAPPAGAANVVLEIAASTALSVMGAVDYGLINASATSFADYGAL